MRRLSAITSLAVPLVILAMSVAASAQQLVPVDQGVGDLDALSRSQRHMETGLRTTGEQSNLFQLLPDGLSTVSWDPYQPQVYYRVGPGYVAQVDRLDYVVRIDEKHLGMNIAPLKDGEFLDLIPANTVFELRPVLPPSPLSLNLPARPATQPSQPDARIDRHADRGRDGRPDAYRIEPVRIDNQIKPVMIDNQVHPSVR